MASTAAPQNASAALTIAPPTLSPGPTLYPKTLPGDLIAPSSPMGPTAPSNLPPQALPCTPKTGPVVLPLAPPTPPALTAPPSWPRCVPQRARPRPGPPPIAHRPVANMARVAARQTPASTDMTVPDTGSAAGPVLPAAGRGGAGPDALPGRDRPRTGRGRAAGIRLEPGERHRQRRDRHAGTRATTGRAPGPVWGVQGGGRQRCRELSLGGLRFWHPQGQPHCPDYIPRRSHTLVSPAPYTRLLSRSHTSL